MKKLFVTYDDESTVTYNMKNSVNHMQYVNRHINSSCVKSIILKPLPINKNEPIVYK